MFSRFYRVYALLSVVFLCGCTKVMQPKSELSGQQDNLRLLEDNHKKAENCFDIFVLGQRLDGVYKSSHGDEIVCDMDGGWQLTYINSNYYDEVRKVVNDIANVSGVNSDRGIWRNDELIEYKVAFINNKSELETITTNKYPLGASEYESMAIVVVWTRELSPVAKKLMRSHDLTPLSKKLSSTEQSPNVKLKIHSAMKDEETRGHLYPSAPATNSSNSSCKESTTSLLCLVDNKLKRQSVTINCEGQEGQNCNKVSANGYLATKMRVNFSCQDGIWVKNHPRNSWCQFISSGASPNPPSAPSSGSHCQSSTRICVVDRADGHCTKPDRSGYFTTSQIYQGYVCRKSAPQQPPTSGPINNPNNLPVIRGMLWKPVSESNGNLVVLTSKNRPVETLRILDVNGRVLDYGKYRNVNGANGGRNHYWFSRPGGRYPSPSVLEVGGQRFLVPNPSRRYE